MGSSGELGARVEAARRQLAASANYFATNCGWTRERITGATRLRAYRLPIGWVDPPFEQFQGFEVQGES